MSKAFVCHGDKTTTGGEVVAASSRMFDVDRRIALDQDMATCGDCS
ncbi:PAAR domain-containing protein [Paraburkholderia bannensis]